MRSRVGAMALILVLTCSIVARGSELIRLRDVADSLAQMAEILMTEMDSLGS